MTENEAIETVQKYKDLESELSKRNLTIDHIREYMEFEDECVKQYLFMVRVPKTESAILMPGQRFILKSTCKKGTMKIPISFQTAESG